MADKEQEQISPGKFDWTDDQVPSIAVNGDPEVLAREVERKKQIDDELDRLLADA